MAIGNRGSRLDEIRTLFTVGTTGSLTDGQLLERFATGEGESSELAFRALVERHGPMVLRVCRGVLADPHETQDAFQATFLVLVRKSRALWVRDSLGPWLHQVAYRTAQCARGSAARRRRHERAAAAANLEALRVERDEEPARILHEEIERLPERFRAPVILCDLEGRTHEQAARHLGWPVGTVKSRLARARERLRDRLRRRGQAPEGAALASLLRPPHVPIIGEALVESTRVLATQCLDGRILVSGPVGLLSKGVIASMFTTQWIKIGTVLLALSVTGSGVNQAIPREGRSHSPQPVKVEKAILDNMQVLSVEPGTFRVSVSGPGRLEASKSWDVYNRFPGQGTIASLLAEGTHVKKGDLVCELDSGALRDQLENQMIVVQTAEANYKNAMLTRQLADLALTQYQSGIFPSEKAVLEGEIATAESALARAVRRMKRLAGAREHLKGLLDKDGGGPPQAILSVLDLDDRLDAAALDVDREKVTLLKSKNKLKILRDFTFEKTVRELMEEEEKTRSNELTKQQIFQIEKTKANKLDAAISRSRILAAGDGMVVLANDPRRLQGSSRIEEGATVRERQKILSIVDDVNPLRVIVKVPESGVDRISPGQAVQVGVDALPGERLNGVVTDVDPLPDPTALFSDPSQKVYTTHVKLDRSPPPLRPGLTARAEILILKRENVITVPVSALSPTQGERPRVALKIEGGYIWRDVILGATDGAKVEIKEGLKGGEDVIMDPRPLLQSGSKP